MTYTPNLNPSLPVPAEPGVLSALVNNSIASTNVLVYVPWKNCRLVYAYAVVTTVIDAVGAMEIDLELNAAGGTEMMTITVPKSSAIGTVVDATFSSVSACNWLNRDNADRDAVNIEIDGSATGTGAVMLYMYFERANIA